MGKWRGPCGLVGCGVLILGCSGTPDGAGEATERADFELAAKPQLFVPPPDAAAVQQITALIKSHDVLDAARLTAMIAAPRATWFTGGTPKEVQKSVQLRMAEATFEKRVPVLVAYDLPFRDCAQYSAGGALSVADYEAWLDGFAKGIGSGKAIVILEPDSLGIIPFYNPFADRDSWNPPGTLEWCQPAAADPATAAADRFAMLNYAVNRLKTNAATSVYLDGTHSGWLGSGDAADRLLQAGIAHADGFFVDTSNFQPTPQLEKYAGWIAKCIWFADPGSGSWGGGHAEWCGSQYSPANPNDFSTWSLTDEWYASNVESQSAYPGNAALKHFVIDTSRNGNGTLDASAYANAPYLQPPAVISGLTAGNWCNPPGAGLGARPKLAPDSAQPLLDAFLWIKTPGESDGTCDIAGGARAWDFSSYNPWGLSAAAQPHFDPLWGAVDPAAGAWFPAQALELARKANPPLF